MLLELTISDFAIIERLQLRLGEEFNVFTGETGAGKSILIDAVSALIGARLGAEAVRSGAERALVEGVFSLEPPAEPRSRGRRLRAVAPAAPATATATAGGEGDEDVTSLPAVLAALGIETEEGTLILSREIARTGRTLARINGRAVTVAALQQVGAALIDIHGQSAHLTILRPEQHVYYLDRFANTVPLRERVAAAVAEWRVIQREISGLERNERELERRVELLRFQAEEIGAARLRSGELDELEAERRVLANAEQLRLLAAQVHAALAGEEGDETPAALDTLAGARRALDDLIRLDPRLADQASALADALFKLEDVVAAVRDYREEVAADPERLAAVEERLDLLARLRRKYGATIEDILAYGAEAEAELDQLTHREERIADLQARAEALRGEIGQIAGQLSARRRAAAAELAAAMERQLEDLSMKRARFTVELRHEPDADGVLSLAAGERESAPPERVAFGPTGIDRVEFLIAPNPGEPFKPLARIASGGETSRLMLALKSILSAADDVPTLIFDEIDAGISGRVGQVVGEKLWQLGRQHQVICVTHLPQMAALGDAHFRVSKHVGKGRTTTQVELLGVSERVEEIAQMLGGNANTPARVNAADLIERGRAWQQGYAASKHG
jgi:DNA repair protein RecN (Recombination protein N)